MHHLQQLDRELDVAQTARTQLELTVGVGRRDVLDDPSPLVRGAAIWALGRLLPAGAVRGLAARHAPNEPDTEARAEWYAVRLPPKAGTDRDRGGWGSGADASAGTEATP